MRDVLLSDEPRIDAIKLMSRVWRAPFSAARSLLKRHAPTLILELSSALPARSDCTAEELLWGLSDLDYRFEVASPATPNSVPVKTAADIIAAFREHRIEHIDLVA